MNINNFRRKINIFWFKNKKKILNKIFFINKNLQTKKNFNKKKIFLLLINFNLFYSVVGIAVLFLFKQYTPSFFHLVRL